MSEIGELRDHVTALETQYVFIKETLGEIKASVNSQGNDIMALKLATQKLTNGGSNIMVSKRAVVVLFGVGVTAAGAGVGAVQKLLGG